MATDKPCAEMTLLLQADIDGELDAAQAASVVFHREQCAQCNATHKRLLELHEKLRAELHYQTPSSEFKAALRARLNAATPAIEKPTPVRVRSTWSSLLTFGGGAALAAVLAFILVLPNQVNLADAVVAEHIRSLQAEHLLDVVSTDQHTVKPWFNGKLDFAPPVIDLAASGFPLTGGRLDYLNGRTVAALIYRHGQHPINLFIWPNTTTRTTTPNCTQRAGYHLCTWTSAEMNFWAVSDLNEMELNQFASNLQR